MYSQPLDALATLHEQQKQHQPSLSTASLRYHHFQSLYILEDRRSFLRFRATGFVLFTARPTSKKSFSTMCPSVSRTTMFFPMIGGSFDQQLRQSP